MKNKTGIIFGDSIHGIEFKIVNDKFVNLFNKARKNKISLKEEEKISSTFTPAEKVFQKILIYMLNLFEEMAREAEKRRNK